MNPQKNQFKNEMELLLTTKPGYKDGIRMPVNVYQAIKNEIFKLLDKEEGVSLSTFFEILHIQFAELLGEDAGWYVYHVKLDMQAKGFIVVEYSDERRNKRPVIKMVERRGRSIL